MNSPSAHASAPPVDVALETLLYPFADGSLTWPAQGRVLFLRARAGQALSAQAHPPLVCEQSFKPFADQLSAAGYSVVEQEGTDHFPLVLVLPPRQREESRALLARAMQRVTPGGIVVAAALNTEGARSAEGDLERLAGSVQSESKHKCRVFWAGAEPAAVNAELIAEWGALDAPRPIADGRFWSRPGLFAWDRIDAASALLAQHLPDDLAGRSADLGAGYGYLSAEVLARCQRVTALDLYEAEARALALARRNLQAVEGRATLGFYWHDVTKGIPCSAAGRYDFIVSNPPFHQGRADLPQIGRAFIAAAAGALGSGGRFWLVANRHLPYEDVLAQHFKRVRQVVDAQGFKVIEAVKGNK